MKTRQLSQALHLVVAEKNMMAAYYFAIRKLLYFLNITPEYTQGDEKDWRSDWGRIYFHSDAILSSPTQGMVLQSPHFCDPYLRSIFTNLAKEKGVRVYCWYSHPYPDIPTPDTPSYEEGFTNIFLLEENGRLLRPQHSWVKARSEYMKM